MGIDLSGCRPAMDTDQHRRTYKGFLRGAITLVVCVAVLLIGMAYFLV